MPYQVLAKGTRHSDVVEEVWRGDTFQKALEKARWWLNTNGKPGEAVVEIWDEDRSSLHLTLRMDAHGLIHDDAGADMDRVRAVWDHLGEIADRVTPGRYDFDHKEYRFAIGGYTVAVTREYLTETPDLAEALKSSVTLERIHDTGTEHTLVLTSGGIKTRPNQA